ncbi:hypothetical protein JAAARDRAFT_37230 [Jaapia argillacea MUCL 33604]|uniref:Uncharacterized protein n=1 Tax=Jaapia argillacea MUCL 33604 TaxID=933084 RepID=A0A067PWZ5_9AGAM|nr:hypothetical protein JAAARDRAFT_37230 [Jaapia argillacea MUCL 33604]
MHTGLSLGAWVVGATTDRMDVKDCLWPSGMVANAWYQAVGIPVIWYNIPIDVVLKELPWRQSLLLAGVSVWGARLFYHIVKRAYKRGYDDPRYASEKTTPGYYLRALFTQFLPEAFFQAVISVPFTAPFRDSFAHRQNTPWGWTDSLAVGLWAAGLALEVLADKQLKRSKRRGGTAGGLYTEGVWSIVRHPNYLGDFLTHLSFPILTLNSATFHPLFFLGPLFNYIFLRYMSGDRETESYQQKRYEETSDFVKLQSFSDYRAEKNAFWPRSEELRNSWSWIVVALGVTGVGLERIVRKVAAPRVL